MNTKDILKKLILRLVKFKRRLIVVSIVFIGVTLLGFFYPIIVKNLTDQGLINKSLGIIYMYSLLLVIVMITEQVASLIQIHLCVTLKNQLQEFLYYEAFTKSLNLEMKYFEGKNSSEILNKLNTDIKAVSTIADNGMVNVLNYLLKIVSGIIGLLLIDKRLTLVVLAFIPLKLIVVIHISKKKEKSIDTYIEKSRGFSSWFSDTINGIREIKLWNLYEIKKTLFFSKQHEVIQADIKSTMMDSYNASSDFLLNSVLTCTLYSIGGYMVYHSYLSIGSMFAFLSYSGFVTGPISIISNIKYIISSIMPSARRLFEFLDLDEEDRNINGKKTDDFKFISFKNVSYNYNNDDLLNNINLTIKKGDKVAIIGKNGSGKTTLLKLLLQILQPITGEINLNGINIKDYNLDNYRKLFSVVSQDTYLFQDTVLNNIDILGKRTLEEVLEICNKSCLVSFIEQLPDGLDSLVKNNGINLSGGEQRKITIARVYAKKSQILILDEFSMNLDIESNRIVYEKLLKDYNNKTIIMITHDYEQLEKLNIVYEIRNGILERIK